MERRFDSDILRCNRPIHRTPVCLPGGLFNLMTPDSLHFGKAKYEGDPPSPDQCAYCHRGITAEYYRVAGHLACPACATQAQSLVPPNSHKVFVRSLGYGAAAAIVGCAAYALFVILSGWTLGWAAIGVGYLVGWAMKRGAGDHGGRRFQVSAALLTYAAVAVAFVPVGLHQMSKHRAAQRDMALKPASRTAPDNAARKTFPYPGDKGTAQSPDGAGNSASANQTSANQPALLKTSGRTKAPWFGRFFIAISALLVLGLVSPFLMFGVSIGGGLLNLFIVFLGVQAAWRFMARPVAEVEGPYEAISPSPLASRS